MKPGPKIATGVFTTREREHDLPERKPDLECHCVDPKPMNINGKMICRECGKKVKAK